MKKSSHFKSRQLILSTSTNKRYRVGIGSNRWRSLDKREEHFIFNVSRFHSNFYLSVHLIIKYGWFNIKIEGNLFIYNTVSTMRF